MRNTGLWLVSSLVTLMFAATSVMAIPEDLPESVCDYESGAAYGLCTAYCDAMNCEGDNPGASEDACAKVSERFTRMTGRSMPCECPCTAYAPFNWLLYEGDANYTWGRCYVPYTQQDSGVGLISYWLGEPMAGTFHDGQQGVCFS